VIVPVLLELRLRLGHVLVQRREAPLAIINHAPNAKEREVRTDSFAHS
jgi:hypothetical protein